MLVATLAQRLGVEALAGRLLRLRRDRPPRPSMEGVGFIVRRTRRLGPQAELWPYWWDFAFLTNLPPPA